MKRILSLILVLVMVLGVMPMASAEAPTDACKNGHTNWIRTATIGATCEQDGSESYVCGETDCGDTVTVNVGGKGDGSCNWADVTPSDDTANCTTAGKKTQVCADCGASKSVDTPAKGHVDELNGSEAGKDYICDVCQTPMSTQVTVSAVVSKNALTVGESVSIGVNYANLPQGVTVNAVGWTSSEPTVLTVSSTGVVTALKKGSATITGTLPTAPAGVTFDKTVVTLDFTVSDVGAIVCAGQSTSGSTITLAPSLVMNGTTIPATFSFAYSEGDDSTMAISANATSATLTRKSSGIDTVTIAVTSYTIGGVTYTGAQMSTIAPINVSVSFYDVVNASATVDSDSTSFLFETSDVFSKVSIEGISVSKPSSASLSTLYTYLGSENVSSYHVAFFPTVSSNSVASITHTSGLSTNAFSSGVYYSFFNSKALKFSCLTAGTFTMDYTLVTAGDLILQTGTIEIKTKEGNADIEYTTSFTKNLTIDESDFAKVWKAAKMVSDLDYVTFGVDSTTPWYGSLYTTSSASTRKAVTDSMKFAYKASSIDDYDLDTVTFVPSATYKKAYTETIPFTCYGETRSEVVYGVMEITVGESMNFTDVKKTDYFYDAVEWAVNKGVTSGTSATTFSPAKTCTRAEVVTFLWRAAGEPDVTGYLPFTDVDDDAYYYDAVLWAYKNDITTGLTSTTFGPHSTVTRGQVVTFLWRAMDEVSVSASNPFNDVKRTDYFYEAVLWAVKNDVTTGLTSTTFGPASGCTRGQIVTFLYRAYEGE